MIQKHRRSDSGNLNPSRFPLKGLKRQKNILLPLAKYSGGLALYRRRFQSRFRILSYHGVDDTNDPLINFDGLQVPVEQFRKQLKVLKSHFDVRPLADVVRAVANREPAGHHVTAITFDDGYANNLTVAAGVLNEFGFPATFFITTGFIDGDLQPWWYLLSDAVKKTKVRSVMTPAGDASNIRDEADKRKCILSWERALKNLADEQRSIRLRAFFDACEVTRPCNPYAFLSSDDVRRLISMGFEIGAHTRSHLSLGHESIERVAREIEMSVANIGRRRASGLAILPIHTVVPLM